MSDFKKALATATGSELHNLAESIAGWCGDPTPSGPGAAEGMPPTSADLLEALIEIQKAAIGELK